MHGTETLTRGVDKEGWERECSEAVAVLRRAAKMLLARDDTITLTGAIMRSDQKNHESILLPFVCRCFLARL